ncbi:hypothetical protein [Pseudaminobacter soli (ex Li et al. 2025)]|uniref:hypothetical protein n=1 Tax=Pseudaminobacter soli (ex Li et al. 2025) TaxID=1295366 RepID=UPI0011B1DDEC|nr:hypothetical protein [Mesorhizobium soli]
MPGHRSCALYAGEICVGINAENDIVLKLIIVAAVDAAKEATRIVVNVRVFEGFIVGICPGIAHLCANIEAGPVVDGDRLLDDYVCGLGASDACGKKCGSGNVLLHDDYPLTLSAD